MTFIFNKKDDFTDVTLCIPVMFDSKDRVDNLNILLEFLFKKFDINIIIGELDSVQRGREYESDSRLRYYYFENNKNYFHRTELLNKLYQLADTNIISNYDCDVFCLDNNYHKSIQLIRDNEYDVVYPYSGEFLDVNRNYIEDIIKRNSVNFLMNYKHVCRHPNSLGGCYFMKREVVALYGGENENFKSWGYEDLERYYRYNLLGCRIQRLDGPLFHLVHSKGKDSSKNNPYYIDNEKEWKKIQKMNKEELQNYINN
jgi:hypothetical protein